ncbi:MAG: VOC family protein [Ferruginibacter sp.]
MSTSIYPCLWFDGNAKAAATFYATAFKNSAILSENSMVVNFQLENQTVMGLNGGPMFKINPSISFMVTCNTAESIDEIWNVLITNGSVMMPLQQYPWSEKYGWLVDQFGMTWQLMLYTQAPRPISIMPSFLFVGQQYGRAKEAIDWYASIFSPSTITEMSFYEPGEPQPAGKLKYAQFSLKDAQFSAMDGFGNHEFKFNEGVSIFVSCKNQEEIDTYWNALTEGGAESRCGWLVDKFGVSWQIVPEKLGELFAEPEKAKRVGEALMKMNKLHWNTLLNA